MANQVEQMLAKQLINASKLVEEQVDAELNKLERLDTDELDNIRRVRLAEMKKRASLKKDWLAQGHGEYSELKEEKEFFSIPKVSDNVVVHFYRESAFRCKIVDKHLDILAKKHIETKFCKIDAEKSPFLTDRLKIKIIPTIALIKDGKTKDFIVGFTDLGNRDDFSTEMMEWRLGTAGIIEYNGDLLSPPEDDTGKENYLISTSLWKQRLGHLDVLHSRNGPSWVAYAIWCSFTTFVATSLPATFRSTTTRSATTAASFTTWCSSTASLGTAWSSSTRAPSLETFREGIIINILLCSTCARPYSIVSH